jgi:hypothetical protein
VLGVGCSLCWGEGIGLLGLGLHDDVGLEGVNEQRQGSVVS